MDYNLKKRQKGSILASEASPFVHFSFFLRSLLWIFTVYTSKIVPSIVCIQLQCAPVSFLFEPTVYFRKCPGAPRATCPNLVPPSIHRYTSTTFPRPADARPRTAGTTLASPRARPSLPHAACSPAEPSRPRRVRIVLLQTTAGPASTWNTATGG